MRIEPAMLTNSADELSLTFIQFILVSVQGR